MVAAPRVAIAATRAARAGYLVTAYADMVADPLRLDGVLGSLRASHPAEVIADWRAMAAAGRFVDLAEGLMERHYDPRYGKHRARMEVPLTEVTVDGLDDLEAVADRVADAIRSMT